MKCIFCDSFRGILFQHSGHSTIQFQSQSLSLIYFEKTESNFSIACCLGDFCVLDFLGIKEKASDKYYVSNALQNCVLLMSISVYILLNVNKIKIKKNLTFLWSDFYIHKNTLSISIVWYISANHRHEYIWLRINVLLFLICCCRFWLVCISHDSSLWSSDVFIPIVRFPLLKII